MTHLCGASAKLQLSEVMEVLVMHKIACSEISFSDPSINPHSHLTLKFRSTNIEPHNLPGVVELMDIQIQVSY